MRELAMSRPVRAGISWLTLVVLVAALVFALGGPDVRGSVVGWAEDRLVAAGAPILANWIRSARAQVLQRGTTPVPKAMQRRLATFFPEDLLARVRFRIGLAPPGSIAELAFQRFGKAVTLGEVIVFGDDSVAADPVIWAHEMAHVWQFERWGIDGFATRYLRHPGAVERDAWALTGRWAEIPPPLAKTDPNGEAEVEPSLTSPAPVLSGR